MCAEKGNLQLKVSFTIIHTSESRVRPRGVSFIEMLKALRRLLCGARQVHQTPNGIIITPEQPFVSKRAALRCIVMLLTFVAVAA